MGKTWARTLAGNGEVELGGWVDVRPGAAEAAAKELGSTWGQYHDDLSTAIDAVRPDFVVDVTPPDVHHHVTLTALGKGVPVIGEKPMANSMAEAREMVTASERAGKLYMVSQSRRYIGRQAQFRHLVRETIGGAGIANVDFSIGAHFGGFRDEMDSVLLLDMAIHTFDQIRFLTGKDPVRVYAEEFNPIWSWYRGAAAAVAIFTMADGARATYRGSWCSEGAPSSWDGDWRVAGPLGSAVWTLKENVPYAEIASGEGFTRPVERVEAPAMEIKEGIDGSLAEFLNALRTGTTPQCECHDNILSLAMVFAAVESSRRGAPVDLADVLAG